MSSTLGTLFRVSTFGESHGKGVGAVVDGVPPGMSLTEEDIQPQLTRRRPGQSIVSTPREEFDKVMILSGTEQGQTLGTPVGLLVHNRDQRPGDYKEMSNVPRPSHADFTYQAKYGTRASSGGGRSSARETIGRVAAGAIAEKFLSEVYGVSILSWVSGVGIIEAPRELEVADLSRDVIDQNDIRCPDEAAAGKMMETIIAARDDHDSVGGVLTCRVEGLPPGLGEPVFGKLEALLAQAMLSIPATKGFEIGSGFAGTRMHGSEHNDMFVQKDGRLGTRTNNSGGIQGGISNGEPIVFRVAFKPPATISKPQETADFEGKASTLEAKGRHDPCVVPRAVPIVEAMTALVLADCVLIQKSRA